MNVYCFDIHGFETFETFSINLFDDTSKHEILQVKMAKIALTVQKNHVTWRFGEN